MPQSVYLHIPFCKNKCNYCSFISFVGYDSFRQDEYNKALIKEIKFSYKDEPIKTLYFGGGTPSLLGIDTLREIINCFKLEKEAEITIEVNPETVNSVYLKQLLNIGFNRISIGIQSFDDSILKRIGRIHKADKAIETVLSAKKVGFNNVSVDFIYGLPDQTRESFLNDLKKSVDLGVQHISLYGLKIDEGCKFFNNLPENLPDDDQQADMYLDAIKILKQNGFEHYEISNFSKVGFESKHNLNYWNCGEYYGFGVAAHGYVDGIRYSNLERIDEYIANYKNKNCEHFLSSEEQLEEMIFLGLRKADGIDKYFINKRFFIDFDAKYNAVLKKYIGLGYLMQTKNGYKLTENGFLLSNIILADFINC